MFIKLKTTHINIESLYFLLQILVRTNKCWSMIQLKGHLLGLHAR